MNTLTARNIFPYKFNLPEKYKETNNLFKYLPTIIITGLILVITIPLLASANPFFNALLQHVLKVLDMEWIFKYIFADQWYVYFIRVLIFLFLMYFIPRIITITFQGAKRLERKQWFSINYLIPKITLAGLLVIFFITQFQLYFASSKTLQSMGYTNSRQTNEVFFQVTIVAFIVFLLAYLDKNKKAWNIWLTYFLAFEAFFLIGIAFKSVYDYTTLWGFTQKRLWGYTSMAWLTGAFLAFIYHYKNKTPHLRFLKQVMTYTMALVLLVNVLNFDYLIYHVDKPYTSAGIDYVYLAGLSPDAHCYKEELAKLMPEIENGNALDHTKIDPAYTILYFIDVLRNKYNAKRGMNSFNISEYQEYHATKDIDIEAYRKIISVKEQKLSQPDHTPSNL